MSLSLTDMENVVRIVAHEVDSVAAAAELLGTDRAYVYRLMQRINAMIGKQAPNWRVGNRLVIPAEIHRLAARMREMTAAFDDATRFPRIAAGSTMAILVHEVLHALNWGPTCYQILRSAQAVDAVLNGEVDLALYHQGSVEATTELPPGLEQIELLEWRAVIVEPPPAATAGAEESRWLLDWPPSTHAARLNTKVWGEQWTDGAGSRGPHLGSYMAALEAIRIGLPFRTAMPDIFLTAADWASLTVNSASPTVKEGLIGLYRRSDRVRLGLLLERGTWERVATRRRGGVAGKVVGGI